ncbi:bacterial regulatory helix-turn-helix s, AraC family protein [Brevibacillus laterosporus GI-9]|uniref:helix-turn-helix domain-containing protein n=1 Tax=Brevibacillus laterosporus TaxID=1465 RepID=UPI000240526C|nr:helix-turn-helix domain-containing protein [Brevibacillus laterosporus]CCF16762.1 bacterial regulatory helix-turn-helix s, AraC family protein [Brevibacillus laterosporus GI-9]
MNLASLYIRLQHYDRFQVDQTISAISHNEGVNNNNTNLCTLLIALSHGIRLYIDKIAIDLRQGSCILVSPVQSYTVESSNGEVQLARFTFETFEVDGMSMNLVAHPPLFCGCPYNLLFSRVKQVLRNEAERRNQFRSSLSASEMAMMQGRLQLILGMMAQLDQQASHLQKNEEKIKMIQHTVHYMEQYYYEDLTVEQLANMAGMVRWQYSQQFKTLTGQKPTDYLVHLRIKHAKKLLCNSTEPLSKISRQIGFKDEYYFSRCFRKLTGNTPREYANIHLHTQQRTVIDSLGRKVHVPKNATRIVTDGKYTLGELLVLGISPIGAAISMKDNVIYHNKLRNIQNIGYWADPDKIAQLQPELVLLSYHHPAQDLQVLDAIAPTVVLDNKFRLFERLRYIAKLFERSKAAEKWITTYEDKVRLVRRQLADAYIAGETATVYLKLGTKFYIMGQNGLAASLYESLGFRPSAQVMHLIEQGQAWVEIKQHQMKRYAGDRNFILASPKELQTVAHCPQIAAIVELTPGKIHFMDATWNYEDPITRGRLLEVLPYIFKKRTM